MKRFSLFALFLCFAVQIYFGQVFYPKYLEKGTEATISWDVSGYYLYLPALFIHNDLKHLSTSKEVVKKYKPTPDLQQAYQHESGNYVLKYSLGQAIQYLPWFVVGHIWASLDSDHSADGFSFPYQFMLSIGMLLLSFLGLWILRKVLLTSFSELATGLTLICIVLGSNYLDYSAINGAMTHNSLFTIYAGLLYSTIKFYKAPTLKWALIIGALVGWAALIRPTELIAAILPIVWGLKGLSFSSIRDQLKFLLEKKKLLLPVVILTGAIGFLQLIYWKYAGGKWIIYSYQDQGFDWLHPHLIEGTIGFQTGWLIYSPLMVFSLIGFLFLWRKKSEGLLAITAFSGLFIYLCFAWSEWTYGGSLGVRAMIQSYPVLAIPMAACFEKLLNHKGLRWGLIGVILFGCVYNLWLTRHAHKGGLLHVGQMTYAYWQKILFKSEIDPSALKLLDTDEEYLEERKNSQVIYSNDFESEGKSNCNGISSIDGNGSLCMLPTTEYSEKFKVPIVNDNGWLNISADFRIGSKEWENWCMTQLVVKSLNKNDEEIKLRLIRIERHLNEGETKSIFMDYGIPKGTSYVEVYFWNPGSKKPIVIDNLKVKTFTSN